MKTLTNEDIQFIENYLENSDILYADIRMEITDHVASAIEERMESGDDRGFYQTFKDYMIEHKAKLLQNNKEFVRNADKSILKQLGKRLLNPHSIALFVLSTLAIYNALKLTEIEQLRFLISLFPIMSIVPFCVIYVILLKWFNLSRFSGIERLGFVQMIIFQFYNFIVTMLGIHVRSTANDTFVAINLAAILTVSIVMIQLTFSVINNYRMDYKNLS